MARVLIHIPDRPKVMDIIEIKALIAHPMESGYRNNGQGLSMPRDIITDFECRFDETIIFLAKLAPAVSANPFFSFHWRVLSAGTLSFRWRGDNGFDVTEQRRLEVA
jgi:sulfur-oxidizing protein SoxZ